jgi:hypothetical protein
MNWAGSTSVTTLAAGATVKVKITAGVGSRPASGSISNTASVSTTTTDNTPTNNSATEATAVNKRASNVVVTCTSPVVVNQASTCTATVSDPGGLGRPSGTVTFTKDAGDSGTFSATTCALPASGANQCSVSYTPSGKGDGLHGITATYGGDATFSGNSASTTVVVNKRHTVTTVACDTVPMQVNTPMTCTATVTDDDPNGAPINPLGTVSFTQDAAFAGSCSLTAVPMTSNQSKCSVSTFTSATPGVFVIVGTYGGSDVHLGSFNSDKVVIVFYDPNAGFVTGGGYVLHQPIWTTPPTPGTGKDNYGFVAKYKKGSSAPDGETEFQCKDCNINFHSTSLDWLIVTSITSGPNAGVQKAWYQGSGTINGSGNYAFQVTVIDKGNVDYFRIRIWNKSTLVVIYDNMPTVIDGSDPVTVAQGGNIVIHK